MPTIFFAKIRCKKTVKYLIWDNSYGIINV